jgi:hypothetical protein
MMVLSSTAECAQRLLDYVQCELMAGAVGLGTEQKFEIARLEAALLNSLHNEGFEPIRTPPPANGVRYTRSGLPYIDVDKGPFKGRWAVADSYVGWVTEMTTLSLLVVAEQSLGDAPDDDWVPSPDFRSAVWKGEQLRFSATQSRVIKLLSSLGPGASLGEPTIMEDCECSRVRDVFRSHTALERLLVSPTKGQWMLDIFADVEKT